RPPVAPLDLEAAPVGGGQLGDVVAAGQVADGDRDGTERLLGGQGCGEPADAAPRLRPGLAGAWGCGGRCSSRCSTFLGRFGPRGRGVGSTAGPNSCARHRAGRCLAYATVGLWSPSPRRWSAAVSLGVSKNGKPLA